MLLYKLYFYNIEQCIKIKEMFKFKSLNIRIKKKKLNYGFE